MAVLPSQSRPNPHDTTTAPKLRHFVAINCHPFHDQSRLIPGLQAVNRNAEDLRNASQKGVVFVLFWHGDTMPAEVQKFAEKCGLDVVQIPHLSNGQNLNHQIDHALANGFDTFFRVDIDDTVFALRFLEQIRALENDEADLIGAGLRYQTEFGDIYETILPERPTTREFLENRYLLHPTLAIKLTAIQSQNLRYKPGRLEDKAFLLDAHELGLRVKNLPILAGDYFVTADARRGLAIKLRALRLNLSFIAYQRAWKFLPYALLLFLLQSTLGSRILRKLRHLIHAKTALKMTVKTDTGLNRF